MKNLLQPDQFPYTTPTGWEYDSGDYPRALRTAMDLAGYDELRREQAEKRERGELMGIGVSFFTEGVGAGPRKHMDILGLGMADGAEVRVHPTGQGRGAPIRPVAGPGPRDDLRADRVACDRASRRRTSRSCTATPTTRRSASARTAAGQHRCPAAQLRWRRSVSSTRPRSSPRRCWRSSPDDLDFDNGTFHRQGRPGSVQDDPGSCSRCARRTRTARRRRGPPRRVVCLQPAEPHLPVGGREYPPRGRRGRRNRRGEGASLHRRRRLRAADQPDDRRRPDPWWSGRRDRDGALPR